MNDLPTHLMVDVVGRAMLDIAGWKGTDVAQRINAEGLKHGWANLTCRHVSKTLTFDVVPAAQGSTLGNAHHTIGDIDVFTCGWLVNAQMDDTPFVQLNDCSLPPSVLAALEGRRLREIVDLPSDLAMLADAVVRHPYQSDGATKKLPWVELHLNPYFQPMTLTEDEA